MGAAVGSALLHLCLLYLFYSFDQPMALVQEQTELEIDFNVVESFAPVAPKVEGKTEGVLRALRPTRTYAVDSKTARVDIGSEVTSGLAHDSPPASPTVARGVSEDRLWSLRGTPVPTLDPFVNKLEAEDSNKLFRHAVPNVVKNPSSASSPRLVEGQGDVKMRVQDGRIAGFEDPKFKFNGLSGRFDLNDVLIRATGKQPYRYEQHRLAEATREDRICQMVEADAQDKRQALYNLKEQLSHIWSQHEVSLEQRQLLIFELWDECTEEDRGDSSGAMARATIEAFIRQNLAPGSSTALTSERLAMLNRRRSSRRVFAPYQSMNWDAGAQGL